MPHKHKRKNFKASSTAAVSSSDYNLPPSEIASPLPIKNTVTTSQINPSKRKSKPQITDDDTPRAFARLINGTYRSPRSGLDDGTARPLKKRKIAASPSGSNPSQDIPISSRPAPSTDAEAPIRMPNESLSAFGARVDVTLPLSGIKKSNKGRVAVQGAIGAQTWTERKMQKMYRQWKEEDRRSREKAMEEGEEGEEDEEKGEFGVVGIGIGKKGKKRRRGRGNRDDGDPWAEIAKKRKEAEGTGGLVGLHDVVKAPPRFTRVPGGREKLKMGKGGLRRQEELREARQSVVDGYRQMMNEKRAEVT